MHIIIIENAEQIRKRTENIHIRISLLLKYVQKIKTARFHFPKHTILTVTASPTLPSPQNQYVNCMAPSAVFWVSMVLACLTSRFIDCRLNRAISSGVFSVELGPS